MAITITDMLLTPGTAHGRPGTKNTPVKLIVHYVGGAGAQAKSVRDYFERGSDGNHVSSHYVVGLKGEVIRCVPEAEVTYHAGRSYGAKWNDVVKTNNKTSISIEVCHPDGSGKFNDVTRAALVALCADICARRGWDTSQILRHYDVAGKDCPLYYVRNSVEWFKLITEIQAAIKALSAPSAAQKPAQKPADDTGDTGNTKEEDDVKRYNTLAEIKAELGEWAYDYIKKLVDAGHLKGDEYGNLKLSEDMIRLLVILDRISTNAWRASA